jgi:TPR repeat protein
MHEFGYGVPVNKENARHYYGLAAAQGDDDAQERLEKLQKKRRPRFLFSENKR